ncbi:MAG: glycosyltransferase family 2 protein [Chitinophagales bacterium]
MVKNFSVLIPVYNFNVFPLVEQLDKIARHFDSSYEILLIDDNSSSFFKEKNKTISSFKYVNYIELDKNIGRSKIRNLLFEIAKYKYCIILDCDVLLAKENFLTKYLDLLEDDNVIVGGHVYFPTPPKDKTKYLHWLYGRKIEVQNLEQRTFNDYASFMTNSFGISKNLFQKLKFNESISEYGHEDTLFGFELEKQKIPIVHINNPVVHLGIDNEEDFLNKQEKAIQNLVKLYKQGNYKNELENNIKLIKFYNLFYNKFFYRFIIKIFTVKINFFKLILPFDFIKLSWLNLWKLKKFDYYFKND